MSQTKGRGSGLEWFVRRGAVVRGPFSSTRVRHFVLEGKLDLGDEVSADGQDWQALGSIAEVVPLQMRSDDSELAGEQAAQQRDDRARALRAIVVTLSLVIALIASLTLLGPEDATGERDCATPPGPGVDLEGCRLAGANMAALSLIGARLANASMPGARFSGSDLGNADMRYVDLTGADLSYARLNRASLKGANLRLADLTNADLSGAELRFADLSEARLGGARLDGVQLDGAIWTDGRSCGPGECPR